MKVTSELLKKYSNGNCSVKEVEAVENWLNFNDTYIDDEIISNDIESRIWDKIKETKKELPRKENRKLINYKVLSIAASVLLLIGISTLFYISNKRITYSTSIGELKTIFLEDGTKITLNAASTIYLDNKFNKTNRAVTLNGEAFFEVTKDSLHPFTITTQKTVTKVLGTQFNLYAYNNETDIVTLNEGKVLFYKKGLTEASGVILKPDEQVVLKEGVLLKNNVNSESYNRWMLHDFIFVNEPLQSIVTKMERKYGVNIYIKKENLKKVLFRGIYQKPTLTSLLEDLSFVLKFEYKQEGKQIIIY